ncbi:MAG: YmdB family metallophosphoesterase [Planctomycetes bacterium]|nr:YmdB family metallophosphoesterase [Planctomycetota bacterium]NBO93306.1 YmdB family metallophosphoesterase [Planctomycetia bacterium]
MRILFIGDIVGTPGVNAVRTALPGLISRDRIDLVIANAENAAGGSGLTTRLYKRLREAGVDLFTLGDHIYKKKEIVEILRSDERLCKPANFPPQAPGREYALGVGRNGTSVAVFSVLGRTYMRPVDCPFAAADRVLSSLSGKSKVIVVDVHAEATADKYLLLNHLQGRVSAVLGTHTHIPTADEHVRLAGTAFICDVGMTGPYDSILGRRVDRVYHTAVTFEPTAFDVAENDVRLVGAIIEVDKETGRAVSIRRLMLDEREIAQLASVPTTT